MKHVEQVVKALLLNDGVYKATKYVSEKSVVRATLRRYRGRISRGGNIEIALTVGRPNFAERKFIAACRKARVTFPVRTIQIKKAPTPHRAG